jgi:hypothetical protein
MRGKTVNFCAYGNKCILNPFTNPYAHETCPIPTPVPTPAPTHCRVCEGSDEYDPYKDYCFEDENNWGKHCWSPWDESPVGTWIGSLQEPGECGQFCTNQIKVYSPRYNYCYNDGESFFWGCKYYPEYTVISGRKYNNCGRKIDDDDSCPSTKCLLNCE